MIYACCTPLRRSVVRGNADWNGIDYLEVVDRAAADPDDRQRLLEVHFVNDLALSLSAANFRIEGGERIQNIKVVTDGTGPGPQADVFTVKVDQAGDFSLYTLRLVTTRRTTPSLQASIRSCPPCSFHSRSNARARSIARRSLSVRPRRWRCPTSIIWLGIMRASDA